MLEITPLQSPLPEGWQLLPLGSMCSKIGSGATPRGGSAGYLRSGTAFIRSQNVLDHSFTRKGLAFVTEEDAEKLSGVTVKARDVLLNITGDGETIARCCLAPYDVLPARVNQHVMIIRADGNLIPEYLQRYLSHPLIREYMLSYNSGGSRRALTKSQVEQFKIVVPPIGIQVAIVQVLGALDHKIALNGQLGRTADELASAFLAGILSGDGASSDIKLGEIAIINQRKAEPVAGGSLRYIDISSVSEGSVEWPSRTSWDEAPGRARRAVSVGDTIWSTVRPNRKSFALILDDDPELVVSTGFAVLTPVRVGAAFLYEISKREEFVQYLESVAEGSAYPAVRAERFAQAVVPLPTGDRLEKFEATALQLRRRVHVASVETRVLTELRDALLPKLMSGEIRVREAERVVGAVVL